MGKSSVIRLGNKQIDELRHMAELFGKNKREIAEKIITDYYLKMLETLGKWRTEK